jgi:ubiquitin-protein ligase E3 D
MMVELLPEVGIGYVYTQNRKRDLEIVARHMSVKEIGVEATEKLEIVKIETEGLEMSRNIECSPVTPGVIKCKHSNVVGYETYNHLPQEGWEELVDHWSCHNSEFKSVLDLRPTPRHGGLLVSGLFLLINSDDMPECCRRDGFPVLKMFHNEICLEGYTHSLLIYLYLRSYFETHEKFFLVRGNEKYEVKPFYFPKIFKMRNDAASDVLMEYNAIKVGFRRTDRIAGKSEYVNEFYMNAIYGELMANEVGAEVLGYRVSFITAES